MDKAMIVFHKLKASALIARKANVRIVSGFLGVWPNNGIYEMMPNNDRCCIFGSLLLGRPVTVKLDIASWKEDATKILEIERHCIDAIIKGFDGTKLWFERELEEFHAVGTLLRETLIIV